MARVKTLLFLALAQGACSSDNAVNTSLRGSRAVYGNATDRTASIPNDDPITAVPRAPDYGSTNEGSCGSLFRIDPSKCGKTPTGEGAGMAEGVYCAAECQQDSDCPAGTSYFTTPKCTMNQGTGKTYCEYTCLTDYDCPHGATCQHNIVAKICTYKCVGPGGDCSHRGTLCCPAGGALTYCMKNYLNRTGWTCVSG